MTYEPPPLDPLVPSQPQRAAVRGHAAEAPDPLAWPSSTEPVMSEYLAPGEPSADPAPGAGRPAVALGPPPNPAIPLPYGPLSADPGPLPGAPGPLTPHAGRMSEAGATGRKGRKANSPAPPAPTAPPAAPSTAPTPAPVPVPTPVGATVAPRVAEGILVGIAAAAIAGTVWWAVTAFTERQFVYLAVVLGLFVGQGVLIGARRGGIACGALAALITLAALAVAQYFIERSLEISQFHADIPLWSDFSFAQTLVRESIRATPLSGVFAVVAAIVAGVSAGSPHRRPVW